MENQATIPVDLSQMILINPLEFVYIYLLNPVFSYRKSAGYTDLFLDVNLLLLIVFLEIFIDCQFLYQLL